MAKMQGWMMGGLLTAVAAVSMLGCGPGNPIVGHWQAQDMSSMGMSTSLEIDFNGDGSGSETLMLTPTCTGSITISGFHWSTMGSSITLTAPAAGSGCSGMLMCNFGGMMQNVDCSQAGSMTMSMPVMGTYSLSSDNNTLTIMSTTTDDAGMSSTSTLTLTRIH